MTAEQFRDIISGNRRGLAASLFRGLFAAAEVPYAAFAAFRNFLYDNGIKKQYRSALPVISVGNLTLGGTGKTPLVAYLAELVQFYGKRPGIISRGYKKSSDDGNDEFQELALRLDGVPHIQNPNRLAAAEELTRQNNADVLILDDAFQHRRIARNVDIVLLDASEPFGLEHLFPRGTLREPLSGLRRADAVVLSRADFIDGKERERIKRRVMSIAPNVVWSEAVHQPEFLFSALQHKSPLQTIHGKRALAFCGIGNPQAFVRTLKSCGVSVADLVPFPDHYRYTNTDLDRLAERVQRCSPDVVLCTMKDIVKIDRTALNSTPLSAVSVGIRFLSGETELQDLLFQSCHTGNEVHHG
ncbi:MAG: tetraacyldisaccharide 4'-kinase [Planctomycetaceae bacterium]|jgi:tetraacyldisaccharide 4'-kinase|nr:tetraacyldisaccharide 4'-kinase [Planctomycetaceae bacterium]